MARSMVRLAAVTTLAVLTVQAVAQRMSSVRIDSPSAAPPSVRYESALLDYGVEPVGLHIELPTPEAWEAAAIGDESGRFTKRQIIGFPRTLPAAFQGDLTPNAAWAQAPDGGSVMSFTVRSPSAHQLRVGLQAVLPEGATVRFFVPGGGPQTAYPVRSRSDFEALNANRLRDWAGLLWSPIGAGDSLGVEVHVPASADTAGLQVRAGRISHIENVKDDAPAGLIPKTSHDGEECPLVDIACATAPSCSRDAVVQLAITDGGGVSWDCTGTVVGTSRDDDQAAPYMLTAAHCVSDAAQAASIEALWFYENTTCDGTDLSPDRVSLRGGANLLVADTPSDMTLVELRDPAPAGSCLAGWDADAASALDGDDVFGIHHPNGGVKKWSWGYSNRVGIRSAVGSDPVEIVEAIWDEGSTQGGSSGSALWLDDADPVVVGTLFAGAACDDFYGRFDVFYRNFGAVHLSGQAIRDDHAADFAGATPVAVGSSVAGSIESIGDADVFRIELTTGQQLTIEAASAFDTYGRLFAEDGTLVAHNDDDGDVWNFRITATLSPGTYYLRVNGYATALGEYTLSVTGTGIVVPLFLAAGDAGRQGFMRLFNASDTQSGEVSITGHDDAGMEYGPVTATLGPMETLAVNSDDLESGNSGKGLTGRLRTGSGDWRLTVHSDLPLEISAYVRTTDGFLTAMHDVVRQADLGDGNYRYVVTTFNPGSNRERLSKLRIINVGGDAASGEITGIDDDGTQSGIVYFSLLGAGEAITVDAAQLEDAAEPGRDVRLTSELGDGRGKWRLTIDSHGEPLMVVNLLDSDSGHITNLSTPRVEPAALAN